VREVFGKGNDFAAKITYAAQRPKGQLQAFRTSPSLRIAVTVDMIATGTDVKPLECVFFMRDVRSAVLRADEGPRSPNHRPERLPGRHPRRPDQDQVRHRRRRRGHRARLRRPAAEPGQERLAEALLDKAAALELTEDETATLASRLAKLELDLTPAEREELDDVAGAPVRDIVRALVDAVDPDTQAKAIVKDAADREKALQDLLDRAVEPIAANPALRQRIVELRAAHDRVIDDVNATPSSTPTGSSTRAVPARSWSPGRRT
jgi:type I restriction enzyme R subunit